MNFEQNIDENKEINLNGRNFTYLGIKNLCLLNNLIIEALQKYNYDFNPAIYYENPRLDKGQLDELFASFYVDHIGEIFFGNYVVNTSSFETISDVFDSPSLDAKNIIRTLKLGYLNEDEKKKYNIVVDLSSSLIQRTIDILNDTHKSK